MRSMKKLVLFILLMILFTGSFGSKSESLICKAEEYAGVAKKYMPKERTWFVHDKLVYRIISKKEVELCAKVYKKRKNKTKEVLRIPEKVTYKGKKYTVTQIADRKRVIEYSGLNDLAGDELVDVQGYSCADYEYEEEKWLPKVERRLFYGTKVILPKTIKYIGEGAFAGNDNLKEVKFASKHKKLVIGKAAFYDCYLKKVVLPKGTVEIGDYAINAKNITIPSSVKKIGAGVVDFDTNKVTIDKKNKNFKMKSGLLYTYDEKKLLGVSAKAKNKISVSPNTVELAEAVFKRIRAEEIDLGGNIKEIPKGAFEGCGLTKLTGTESLEKISYGAFCGCGLLKEIENVSNVKEIETAAFWNTGNLTLPISSNMNISDYAFSGLAYGVCSKVTVAPNDPVYSLENGFLIKKEGDRKKVILQTEPMEKIVVPEGVTDVMVLLGENSLGISSICKEVILPTTLLAQKGNIYLAEGTVRFLGETPPGFGEKPYGHNFRIWNDKGLGTVIVPKNCKEAYRKAIDSVCRPSMFEDDMLLQEAL